VSLARFAAVDRGIPRKFSARPSERLYNPQILGYLSERGVDVLVDGKLLDDAASWDVDAGTVTRQRRDKNGELILSEAAPTFETLEGEVEVRWSKQGPVA
jgi:hypothetical protein